MRFFWFSLCLLAALTSGGAIFDGPNRFTNQSWTYWYDTFTTRVQLNYTLVVRTGGSVCNSNNAGMSKAYNELRERPGWRHSRAYLIGNQVYIARLCKTFGVVAHEISHVLGLYHTQTRSDRDQYVRLANQKGFFPAKDGRLRTNNLVPYDYGSLMHYTLIVLCFVID